MKLKLEEDYSCLNFDLLSRIMRLRFILLCFLLILLVSILFSVLFSVRYCLVLVLLLEIVEVYNEKKQIEYSLRQ